MFGDAPVFILGSHKSGTSLLRSLFDGHPDLYVVPTELHFFQFTGHWIEYPLRKSEPVDLSLPERKQRLIAAFLRERGSDTDPFADAAGFDGYDLEAFRTDLENRTVDSLPDLLLAYARATHVAQTGREPAASSELVEKSVENAEYATELLDMFPGARFIHVIRDPFATLVALRRSKTDRGYPSMSPLARSLQSSYYHLFRNENRMAGYQVVRFEDLLTATEPTMRTLSGQLAIKWTDSLLAPSSAGRPWKGNSTSGETFTGISTRPLDDWRDHIGPYEVALASRLGGPVIERYGYPIPPAGGSAWRPMTGEGPRTYLRNRVFLHSV